MFEVLFIYPKVLARHQAGPAALDRERYLAHCAGQGAAHGTLLRIARELLVIAERIDVTVGKIGHPIRDRRRPGVGTSAEAAVPRWKRTMVGHLFAQVAAAWLRFLGILEAPPHSERNAFFSRGVDEFIAHLRDERGLSPNTVGSRRWQIEGFLDHVSSRKASIASITVADVDAFLECLCPDRLRNKS